MDTLRSIHQSAFNYLLAIFIIVIFIEAYWRGTIKYNLVSIDLFTITLIIFGLAGWVLTVPQKEKVSN